MRKPIEVASVQGSVSWLKERCGLLTASRMADAMDFTKKGEGAARRKLRAELVAERLTDMMVSRYVNEAMEWGISTEPAAKARYEEVTGEIITPCGFYTHGEISFFGASPDGIVGDDGLIEVKCPTTMTYAEWVIGGVVPEQHKPQMLAQLAVMGRRYVDFFAFDPRVKAREHQHFLRRFEPPEADISAVEEAARAFLREVDAVFTDIVTKGAA